MKIVQTPTVDALKNAACGCQVPQLPPGRFAYIPIFFSG